MTHILSREKDFAFIHLPKNGGSTIREQFRSFDDCGQKFFFQDRVHPDLGEVAFGHLPLWVIAKYYPTNLRRSARHGPAPLPAIQRCGSGQHWPNAAVSMSESQSTC